MHRIASIMWHVLPSFPRICLCVEDMDALIVVDFIAKVVRAKIVQEQDNHFYLNFECNKITIRLSFKPKN